MTPAERIRRGRSSSESDELGQLLTVEANPLANPLEAVVNPRTAKLLAAWPEGVAAAREALRAKRSLRRGEMGTRWYHCLVYPFHALPLLAALCVMLVLIAAITMFLIPVMLDPEMDSSKRLLIGSGVALAWLAIVSYACAFLDCVLASSAAGEVRQVHWPGRSIGVVAMAIITWFICFLAGPVVPCLGALWFWDHLGDPAFIDKVILAELCVVSATYWILAIMSVAVSGRLWDASPLPVADLAYDLGLGTLLAVVLAAILAVSHFYWVYALVMGFHRNMFEAILQFGACCLSGLFSGTVLMRYLGLCCYRRRRTIPATVG